MSVEEQGVREVWTTAERERERASITLQALSDLQGVTAKEVFLSDCQFSLVSLVFHSVLQN